MWNASYGKCLFFSEILTCCRNGHEMHTPCILNVYLSQHKTCPVCRDPFLHNVAELFIELSILVRASVQANEPLFDSKSKYLNGLLTVADLDPSLKWIRDYIKNTLSVKYVIVLGQVKLLWFSKRI